jgi:hypothetical protein
MTAAIHLHECGCRSVKCPKRNSRVLAWSEMVPDGEVGPLLKISKRRSDINGWKYLAAQPFTKLQPIFSWLHLATPSRPASRVLSGGVQHEAPLPLRASRPAQFLLMETPRRPSFWSDIHLSGGISPAQYSLSRRNWTHSILRISWGTPNTRERSPPVGSGRLSPGRSPSAPCLSKYLPYQVQNTRRRGLGRERR